MSPEEFLAAFDREWWLTIEEIVNRLDKADYWRPCWPPLSPDQKVSFVKAAGRTLNAVDDVPTIAWRERKAGSAGLEYVFKRTDALTLDDYRELYGYLLGILRDLRGPQVQCPCDEEDDDPPC